MAIKLNIHRIFPEVEKLWKAAVTHHVQLPSKLNSLVARMLYIVIGLGPDLSFQTLEVVDFLGFAIYGYSNEDCFQAE